MTVPRLTPHQKEVLVRLTRYSKRMGWVPEDAIGSHSACWHLIKKGLIEHREEIGPRGGTHYFYRPLEIQS